MKYFYIGTILGLAVPGMQAALFKSTTNKQTMNISCYDNLKINAEVQAGGSIVVATGSCNIQSSQGIGKAGNIIDIKNLPGAIMLGQIKANDIKEANNIATPAPGNMVRFSFGTSSGLAIEFLIERVAYAKIPKELQQRGLEQQAQELRSNNPGQTIELFVFYRTIPGVTLGWLDLGQDITISNNVAPRFNVAIDSSGKVLISSPGSTSIELFNTAVIRPEREPQADVTTFEALITHTTEQMKRKEI